MEKESRETRNLRQESRLLGAHLHILFNKLNDATKQLNEMGPRLNIIGWLYDTFISDKRKRLEEEVLVYETKIVEVLEEKAKLDTILDESEEEDRQIKEGFEKARTT
jgi:hypothetical protein